MIRIIIKLFSIQAENKNINLTYEGPEDLKAYIDREIISSVIRNLLSNALKFTPRNGNVTIIAGEETIQDARQVVVQVKDTGVGMSEEMIETLLTKNMQSTTFGTENEKGSGLGIQLCKDFLLLSKGKLWIESTIGKGSCFFISLPLSEK